MPTTVNKVLVVRERTRAGELVIFSRRHLVPCGQTTEVHGSYGYYQYGRLAQMPLQLEPCSMYPCLATNLSNNNTLASA